MIHCLGQRGGLSVIALLLGGTTSASAQWNVSVGGNSQRDGRAVAPGPHLPELAWCGSLAAGSGYPIAIDGDLVATSRVVSTVDPSFSWIAAHDLESGTLRWQVQLPVSLPGAWVNRVTGARDGRVYATLAGNGNVGTEYLYALDAADGSILWRSEDVVKERTTESVAYTPNGDLLLIGEDEDEETVQLRIRANDGTTVWSTARTFTVSGGTDAAVFGDRAYICEAGPTVRAIDLATGAKLHSTSPGGVQLAPFVGPDGTVYVARAQNVATIDFLYAYEDTGSSFVERWCFPTGFIPFATHGVGPDGSIYTYDRGLRVVRLDPETGELLDQAEESLGGLFSVTARMAVGSDGLVYVSDGCEQLICYTPELEVCWTETVPDLNLSGPAIAQDGTLLTAGSGDQLRAYRSGCAGFTAAFGPGCAGGGGFTPRLEAEGCAEPGGSLTLRVSEGSGGVLAWLCMAADAVGYAAYPSCDTSIGPILGRPIAFRLDGSGPGGGSAERDVFLPTVLAGVDVYAQVFVRDRFAPDGVSATNALRVRPE